MKMQNDNLLIADAVFAGERGNLWTGRVVDMPGELAAITEIAVGCRVLFDRGDVAPYGDGYVLNAMDVVAVLDD